MGTDDRVTVGCKVDPATRQKLRLIAAARDTSMSEILRDELEEVIENAELPEEQLDELPATSAGQ